jgi:hypothetical protein
MIETTANLWDYLASDYDALCITTNGTIKQDGRGVMGRGVAAQLLAYLLPAQTLLGQHLQRYGNSVGFLQWRAGSPAIVVFPVKHQWHEKADPALIRASAYDLLQLAGALRWQRVVLPRPGCGNGGLRWEDVRPILQVLDNRFTVVHMEGFDERRG